MATATTTPASVGANLDEEARARLANEYQHVAERLHAAFDDAVGADEVSDRSPHGADPATTLAEDPITVLPKTLLVDVPPKLRATNGWPGRSSTGWVVQRMNA